MSLNCGTQSIFKDFKKYEVEMVRYEWEDSLGTNGKTVSVRMGRQFGTNGKNKLWF